MYVIKPIFCSESDLLYGILIILLLYIAAQQEHTRTTLQLYPGQPKREGELTKHRSRRLHHSRQSIIHNHTYMYVVCSTVRVHLCLKDFICLTGSSSTSSICKMLPRAMPRAVLFTGACCCETRDFCAAAKTLISDLKLEDCCYRYRYIDITSIYYQYRNSPHPPSWQSLNEISFHTPEKRVIFPRNSSCTILGS